MKAARAPQAFGLFLGLLCLFFPGGIVKIFAQTPSSMIGMPAPSFELTDLTGKTHTVSYPLPEKQVLLLFFYDPRSAPSIQEMAWLDTMQRYSGHRGFSVLAVEASGLSVAETRDSLARYKNLYPAPAYPICPDPDYKVSRLYQVRGIPSTVIVGSDGVVVSSMRDFSRASEAVLALSITQAIHRMKGMSTIGSDTSAPEGGNTVTTPASPSVVPAEEEQVGLGSQMPHLELVDLSGKRHELGVPNPGVRATVVFFWGSVCLPCMLEMTYFNQLYRGFRDHGLQIIGIQASGLDVTGTEGALKRYQRLYTRPVYPIVPDPGFVLGKRFGAASGGPATFIADRNGQIIYASDQFVEGQEDKVTETIADCLGVDARAMRERLGKGDTEAEGASESEAESVVERMTKEKTENDLMWGNRLYERREYNQALEYYLEYLKAVPNNIEIQALVAQIYERKSDFNAAHDHWMAVLRVQPGNDMAIIRIKSIRQKQR